MKYENEKAIYRMESIFNISMKRPVYTLYKVYSQANKIAQEKWAKYLNMCFQKENI